MATEQLNIIGAGRAAMTLARLWHDAGHFRIGQILNRSLASAQQAVNFIGAGEAISTPDEVRPSELTLIGVPDTLIAAISGELTLAQGSVCFHLSGSQAAYLMTHQREQGVAIGSLHPVKSFADPALSVENFAGTYCGLEGDPQAVALLDKASRSIGGIPFQIDPSQKTLYHAGSVMVCNYLNALMEAGLRCFEQAGIERQTALALAHPIVSGTVDNIFRLGPTKALTGPIVRGDHQVVAQHLEALASSNPQLAELYQQLGRLAVDLAIEQGTGDTDGIEEIASLLNTRQG